MAHAESKAGLFVNMKQRLASSTVTEKDLKKTTQDTDPGQKKSDPALNTKRI